MVGQTRTEWYSRSRRSRISQKAHMRNFPHVKLRPCPRSKVKAAFIQPMLLLRKVKLPEGREWLYEIKLDGYRALAIKSGRKLQLRSRNIGKALFQHSSELWFFRSISLLLRLRCACGAR